MAADAVAALPTDDQAQIDALQWNGERLFQVAKFGTEMQYQHLVFEEFARTVQPMIDPFFAPTQVYDVDLNPAIVAEFAHTVYRFGHSMLTETVDRFDANFNPVVADPLNPDQRSAIGPDRGLPQSARVCRERPDAGRGDQRHRARHHPRRSATRSTSSSPRRCATTCSALPLDLAVHQPRARPRHRHSVPERGAARFLRPNRPTAWSSPTRAGPTSCST